MKVGIIDADLIGRSKHRFPNLACEKISGYWKDQGADVHLLLDYNWPDDFDHVYISKVFTDTPVPYFVEELVDGEVESKKVHIGGTGFYFDKAPNLPDEIEHHMPDYHLYDEWISNEVLRSKTATEADGKTFNQARYMVQFKEYTDYSIGFITRGCFRKCKFCVNQKFDHVFPHSPLEEFYDPKRKKICLLDDNFLGCPQWKTLLQQLIDTGKSFKFKQGLDERILTDEKCRMLFNSNYDGDFTFAFDNIADYELIHKQLRLIRKYNQTKSVKFYVLVGFEGTDELDIEKAFKRVELLLHYRCLPYIMRYMNKNDTPWQRSPYRDLYVTMARWCNQPSIIKKMTFREFCKANQLNHKTEGTYCSAMRSMLDFEEKFPNIAKRYFDIRFGEDNPNIID